MINHFFYFGAEVNVVTWISEQKQIIRDKLDVSYSYSEQSSEKNEVEKEVYFSTHSNMTKN
jgi:hypothetical protein